MDHMIDLLKEKNYQIPPFFLFHYRDLQLTDQEFIMLFYLWNSVDNSYNPKRISNDLGIDLNEVLEIINNLSEKGFLSLNIVKVNNIRSEVINLDSLYEKLSFFLLGENDKKESTNLYDVYEKELGRQLSPTEIEIMRGWLETGYSEELLVLALKEAIYNGVTNFRYIDRIIFEWNKKGIKNKEDVEKNRKQFKKSKENKELFDYDWLNDDDRKDS